MTFPLALALLAANWLPLSSTDPGAKEASIQLNAEGLREYRAHDYAAACPLFQRAAGLQPDRGAYWSDAGICWEKLGQFTKARAANAMAARSAEPDARLHAWFNLAREDAGVAWPAWDSLSPHACGDSDNASLACRCAPLPADTTCRTAPLIACFVDDTTEMGNGGGTERYSLIVARTEAEATTCQRKLNDIDETSPEGLEQRLSDDPQICAEAAAFELGKTEECFGHQHPETCEKFEGEDTRRSPPRIVFVDACAGRIGYVWNGKPGEAFIPKQTPQP